MDGKSKLTLVVDGNWLLMSRLSILNGKYEDEYALMKDLKILMIKSINIVLRHFQYIDDLIFVADHGSWRNKQQMPSFLISDGIEYKGNRVKADDINWDIIFKEYDRFIDLLKEKGIKVSHEYDVEGDDWCWYWSQRLNKEHTNCIIWSRDKDLTQLVDREEENGFFTVIWSKEAGLTLKDERDAVVSFLMNPYYSSNDMILNDIVQKSSKKNYINPESVMVDKIIRGDAGDNIIPIILVGPKKQNGDAKRTYRVTTKELPEKIDIYNDVDIYNYINSILESKKYANRITKPFEDIVEHFKYNRMLVVLNESSYPEYIKKIFSEYDSKISLDDKNKDLSDVEAELIAQKNEIQSILDLI